VPCFEIQCNGHVDVFLFHCHPLPPHLANSPSSLASRSSPAALYRQVRQRWVITVPLGLLVTGKRPHI